MSGEDSDAVRAMARRCAELREALSSHRSAYLSMAARVDQLEHERHGAWRQWKVAHRVAGWAYQLGLISGHGAVWNGACSCCLTGPSWRGRRNYILGWRRDRWTCLMVGRHRRREIPGANLCAVCAPCWACQSTDPRHDAWGCERAHDDARCATEVAS